MVQAQPTCVTLIPKTVSNRREVRKSAMHKIVAKGSKLIKRIVGKQSIGTYAGPKWISSQCSPVQPWPHVQESFTQAPEPLQSTSDLHPGEGGGGGGGCGGWGEGGDGGGMERAPATQSPQGTPDEAAVFNQHTPPLTNKKALHCSSAVHSAQQSCDELSEEGKKEGSGKLVIDNGWCANRSLQESHIAWLELSSIFIARILMYGPGLVLV